MGRRERLEGLVFSGPVSENPTNHSLTVRAANARVGRYTTTELDGSARLESSTFFAAYCKQRSSDEQGLFCALGLNRRNPIEYPFKEWFWTHQRTGITRRRVRE